MSNMCYCPSEKKGKKKSGSKLSEVYPTRNPIEEQHWSQSRPYAVPIFQESPAGVSYIGM